MNKLLITTAAVLARSASAAFAWDFKDNTTYDQSNPIGQSDAQITHNGWAVGGNKAYSTGSVYEGADQTTAPGSRAGLVQGALGHAAPGTNGAASTDGHGHNGR